MEFLRMSSQDFRKMLGAKKNFTSGSKYHAQKTSVGGKTYDSKKEANRAMQLQYMEKAGLIHDLQEQVRFILQDGFVNNEKKTIRPIYYFADFCYEKNGIKIVEDTKGVKTEVYKIKKKLFQYKYPEYKFIES